MGFPKFIRAARFKIKRNYDYKINLEFDETNAKDNLIHFLNELEIDSCKEWHKEDLKKGIDSYIQQLNEKGLSSCEVDILGGGNWSFSILVLSNHEMLL